MGSLEASTERRTFLFWNLLGNLLKVGNRRLLFTCSTKTPQMEGNHTFRHNIPVYKSQEEAHLGGVSCIETHQCPLQGILTEEKDTRQPRRAEHSYKARQVTPLLQLRQRKGLTIHTRGLRSQQNHKNINNIWAMVYIFFYFVLHPFKHRVATYDVIVIV